MGESFPFFDIIFLAMVAAFILLRLRAVLGRRTGHEKSRHSLGEIFKPTKDVSGEKPVSADSPEETDAVDSPESREEKEASAVHHAIPDKMEVSPEAESGLKKIFARDSSLNVENFCSGASMAFETIITAFSRGDRKTLSPLLAPSVFDDFTAAMKAREKNGHKMETTLVSLETVTLTQAMIDRKHQAEITVAFQSQQINILKDKEGAILDGDRGYVENVTDLWVFRRDLSSSDPNWILVATLDPETTESAADSS